MKDEIRKKLNEIKEIIKNSKNPYFLFDDDPDGLSSFLLMYKLTNKGDFSVVRGKPRIDQNYLNTALRHNPDLIVILDKPEMNDAFFDSPVKIVWIDHHQPIKTKNIVYFNPLNYNYEPLPTTYWVYEIVKKAPWIAAIGIVGDWYVLDIVKKLSKDPEYSWLFNVSTFDPGELNFNSVLGKLIKRFSFILKGETSKVKRDIRKLLKVNSPVEILDDFDRSKKIEKHYNKILNKALKKEYGDVVLFLYESKISFTGLLSNELLYRFPNKKLIIVGRRRVYDFSLSLRSSMLDVSALLNEAIKGLRASGGGHKHACGATVNINDFDIFIDRIYQLIKTL